MVEVCETERKGLENRVMRDREFRPSFVNCEIVTRFCNMQYVEREVGWNPNPYLSWTLLADRVGRRAMSSRILLERGHPC